MPLTYSQGRLIARTFEELQPLPDGFGMLFYKNLFEIDPELQALFRTEIERQAPMLVNALTLAVMNLTRDGRLSKAVADLGVRHTGYGVLDGHYESFGAALLKTLGEHLGDRFTEEVEEAWAEAYRDLAGHMRAAAAGAGPAAG
jgi:hemoglobin-like flavoprotein